MPWSLHYYPSAMVPALWSQCYGSQFYGPCTMVPALWFQHYGSMYYGPMHYGPYTMVLAIWSQHYGSSAMVPALQSQYYGPSAMVPELICILNIIGCSPHPIPNAKFEQITIQKELNLSKSKYRKNYVSLS